MSGVTRREKIETEFMELHIGSLSDASGHYVQSREPAYAWRCDGCGLVWDKRHFATECESRGHKAHWMAGPYGVQRIENGKPVGNIRWYPRDAIRREKVTTPLPA